MQFGGHPVFWPLATEKASKRKKKRCTMVDSLVQLMYKSHFQLIIVIIIIVLRLSDSYCG